MRGRTRNCRCRSATRCWSATRCSRCRRSTAVSSSGRTRRPARRCGPRARVRRGNAAIVRTGDLLFVLKDERKLMVARSTPGRVRAPPHLYGRQQRHVAGAVVSRAIAFSCRTSRPSRSGRSTDRGRRKDPEIVNHGPSTVVSHGHEPARSGPRHGAAVLGARARGRRRPVAHRQGPQPQRRSLHRDAYRALPRDSAHHVAGRGSAARADDPVTRLSSRTGWAGMPMASWRAAWRSAAWCSSCSRCPTGSSGSTRAAPATRAARSKRRFRRLNTCCSNTDGAGRPPAAWARR